MTDLHYLAASVVLTWIMLITASLLRTRSWTPQGRQLAFGNRDHLPEPTPLAARADRAAKNMLENMVLFVGALFAARAAGAAPGTLAIGATIFFWARLAFFFAYLAGIKFVRTGIWAISIAGVAILVAAALSP